MDSSDDEIDNTWVNEFYNLEKDYDQFYKEIPKKVEIFFLYVNSQNEIESLKKNIFDLNDSKLDKNRIIYLIKNNQCLNNKYYKLISLLKFNPTIEPDIVIKNLDEDYESEYLTSERFLTDMHFDDTINIFQDLNSVFMIFYAPKLNINNTKKILMHTKMRKTKKKKLKAENT
tara:strand:- start:2425 stop:2943 length:519 start_codon:yes stop_codon:yes gene_type:complete